MSTLFVQSSPRNTKSFASKYSCLWRWGGARLYMRNPFLRNGGIGLQADVTGNSGLWLYWTNKSNLHVAVTCSSHWINPPLSLKPKHPGGSGLYLWEVQHVGSVLLAHPLPHPLPSVEEYRADLGAQSLRLAGLPTQVLVSCSFSRKPKGNLVTSGFSNLAATVSLCTVTCSVQFSILEAVLPKCTGKTKQSKTNKQKTLNPANSLIILSRNRVEMPTGRDLHAFPAEAGDISQWS